MLKFLSLILFLVTAFTFLSFSSSKVEPKIEYQQKGWKILGQSTVKEGLERDEIRVNEKKGTFSQLKFKVKRAPVEMTKMVVMFEKGGKQVLWPKKNFEAGSWSKVFNIEGGKKAIKKVVFYYSKKNPEDEESVVELWGRQK